MKLARTPLPSRRGAVLDVPGATSVLEPHAAGSLVPGLDAAGRDRISSFLFVFGEAPPVWVLAYVPPSLSRRTRAVVVMHGRLRNAPDYLRTWTAWAAETDHVVLTPCFDQVGWPGTRGYNLGNVFSSRDGRSRRVPDHRWAFTVVEALYAGVRLRLGLEDERFALWGHSAGGQFVHRLLLFRPEAKVRTAIAAGCGWFTVPDPETRFPYGTAHPLFSFTSEKLRDFVSKPLVLMRGCDDTSRDRDLRVSPLADAQGPNRYARAGFMDAAAKALDPRSPWRLVDVPGVGHDAVRMAAAAQEWWASHS